MSTSEDLDQLQELVQLYQDSEAAAAKDSTTVWDELLRLIEGVVQKILDKSIGANGQTIGQLIDGIKSKVTGIVTDITTVVNGVKTDITTAINGVKTDLTNAVGDIIDGVTNGVTDLITDIQTAIKDAINGLIDKVTNVVDAIKGIGSEIGEWIAGAIDYIGTWISDTATTIVNGVKAYLKDVYTTVSNVATQIVNSVKDEVTRVYNGVKDWLAGVYQSISDTATRLVQGIKDTYETTKETVLTKIKEILDFANGIKVNIESWFRVQWQTVVNWYNETVRPNIKAANETVDMIIDLTGKVWSLIEKGDYQGAFDMVDNIAKGLGIPAPLHVIHAIVSTVAYFWESIRLQFVPLEVAASKRANIALALDPISLDQAANGVYRGLMDEKSFFYNASLGGVSKDRGKVALEVGRPLPTPGQVQQLFLRGEIDEADHDSLMASYGFSQEHIKEIKALYAIIPGVQDIIRMAVREAFSPDIAERFGQYEDLPEAFVSWAKKQGLTEEWAGRYWAAHWDLPSPNMGFEMFQRRIIDKDDLTLLLRALDVMPFWREKLIQLSYNPPTRVDVRRMYKMGVITEEQVYQFHLDIGYSPDNAKLLTEFTKRYSGPEDTSTLEEFASMARSTYSTAYKNRVISPEEYKEFLKGLKYADEDINLLISLDDYAILQREALFDPLEYRNAYYKIATTAYVHGLLNRDDARMSLEDLGLSEDETQMELDLLDYNRQVSLKDVLIQQLHNQFVSFIIDEVELHVIMDSFGYYANEVDRLIEEWNIERSFRDKRPAMTDIKKFYQAGLITLEQFLDELRGMGYHEKYISMFEKTLSKAQG